MQLAIPIKDAFSEVFTMIPLFGLWLTLGPYVHFVRSLPPVWCEKICQVLI
jgi:hypothetical protein